jgi:hypothetical protein
MSAADQAVQRLVIQEDRHGTSNVTPCFAALASASAVPLEHLFRIYAMTGMLRATDQDAVAHEPARAGRTPKCVLALPDLKHAKSAVLSRTSQRGQQTYDHAIREFVAWYCSEPRLAFNRAVVLR